MCSTEVNFQITEAYTSTRSIFNLTIFLDPVKNALCPSIAFLKEMIDHILILD